MLDLDFQQLNLGIHPSKAVTLIHHIETIYGVTTDLINNSNAVY